MPRTEIICDPSLKISCQRKLFLISFLPVSFSCLKWKIFQIFSWVRGPSGLPKMWSHGLLPPCPLTLTLPPDPDPPRNHHFRTVLFDRIRSQPVDLTLTSTSIRCQCVTSWTIATVSWVKFLTTVCEARRWSAVILCYNKKIIEIIIMIIPLIYSWHEEKLELIKANS